MPTEATLTQLRIEKLVYGGEGLARPDGRVVLTPFVLPGELVSADVQRVKNDLFRGVLREVMEPAAGRIEAACPYFLRCGGCHYQHMSAEDQAEQKRGILLEVLRRVGRIEFAGDIGIVSGEAWGYRNRTQLHVQDGTVGFYAPGSHKVIAVDHCPISSPKLNEAIAKLAHDLPRYRFFEATVELFTNESEVQVNVLDRVPPSARPLFAELGTFEPIEYAGFRVSRNAFFQVNRFLGERLVEAALGDGRGDTALDLYAGGGLFARRMADRFAKVTAVEPGGSAFRDLEFNVPGVECVKQTVEEYLPMLEAAPDLILADPPRAGLGKLATRELLRLHAGRVTIVSCDPATLARDLRVLLDGGYRIEGITLVDLFPQTFHLETVVHLAYSPS